MFVPSLLLNILLLTNPVFSGADPDAAVIGKEFWIYPTSLRDHAFHGYSSNDLQHWTDRGTVCDLQAVAWVNADGVKDHGGWAPTILAAKDKFYFYYAVGPQTDTQPSRIGVAVGDKPQGPFKDIGKPLINDGGHGFEAIDPMTYRDPKSGKTFLYAGGSAGATLRVWELNDDLISLKSEVKVDTPKQFTEGVFMSERDGVYYLSYSHGRWNDADYSVHYATAETPTGPWNYRGCVLQSDGSHKGPGHHSFIENPTTHQWFIVYHRWDTTKEKGPYRGRRQVAIEKIEFDKDGLIQPIKMSDQNAVRSEIK